MIKSYAGNWAALKFGADVSAFFSHIDAAWSEILKQVPSAKLPQKNSRQRGINRGVFYIS